MLGTSDQLQVTQRGLVVYQVPNFNQECDLCFWDGSSAGPVYASTVCQVRGIPRLYSALGGGNTVQSINNVIICFPAYTAVYGSETDDAQTYLIVQNPADSTVYLVMSVWDVAQGFSNEYRVGLCRRHSPLIGQ